MHFGHKIGIDFLETSWGMVVLQTICKTALT